MKSDDAERQKQMMDRTNPARSTALLLSALDEMMTGPNPLTRGDFDRLVARNKKYDQLRPQFEKWLAELNQEQER